MITLGLISAAILGGLVLMWCSQVVQSTFLVDFLRTNLLLLLPALMAINVTTAGVVMTKLRELGDKFQVSFSSTISAMKSSFYQQTALMLISAILLVIDGAHHVDWISPDLKRELRFFLESLVCACFIYALIILYDTAKSIFVLLKFEDKRNNGINKDHTHDS